MKKISNLLGQSFSVGDNVEVNYLDLYLVGVIVKIEEVNGGYITTELKTPYWSRSTTQFPNQPERGQWIKIILSSMENVKVLTTKE